MAEVYQVYAILNAAKKQAYGDNAVDVVDTSSMIALGDKVLSSDKDKELFTNALMDVIGRTIFSVRSIPDGDDGVTKKPFDYGLILRKIYADVPDAQENDSWKVGEEGYEPKFAPIMKPTVSESLFDAISTFEYGVTITDYLWTTCFHNESEMAALIAAIFTQRDNNIKESKKVLVKLTRATLIAHVLKNGTAATKVNLLKGYNEETGSNLTAAQALVTKEFLRWANMKIAEYTDWLADDIRTTIFNQKGYKRYTPKDLQVLTVLSKYAKASTFYLESSEYHDTFVALPMYNEESYWQGIGEAHDYNSMSSINIQLPDGSVIKQNGIVAVLHDWETIGVMIDRERTVTQRNDWDEYTNYGYKSDRGYFIDLSEQAVVFYVSDNDAAPITLKDAMALNSSIPVASVDAEISKGKNKRTSKKNK